jgi:threonine/homoserine/homoserine lactone efflux protein
MNEEYWRLGAIRTGAVAPLVFTALAIMGSPGPATISLTAAGSAYGVRRSLGYLAGIVIGTWAVLLAVATGITATLLAIPALRSVLVAGSAVYLLWLAYRIATAPAPTPTGGAAGSAAPSLRGGALLGIANPKAWVAIGAVFASAHLASGATADAAAKVAVLSAVVVLISGAWLLVGASVAPLLRGPRSARVVNVALAAALIAATAFAIVH